MAANSSPDSSFRAWSILAVLSVAEFLGLALWFSATAVLPALSQEWGLTDSGQA